MKRREVLREIRIGDRLRLGRYPSLQDLMEDILVELNPAVDPGPYGDALERLQRRGRGPVRKSTARRRSM